MDIDEKIKLAIAIEASLLFLTVAGISVLDSGAAEAYRLFELLGVILSSIITTYGLYKMRELT